ncbi:conjugal transfer protein TraI [Chitinophaga niabensis]|uniref:conjugal transfer protein TraI n=1 Tax=Chitinophaga niabensis TaxID=536979 RepID=UPI0011614063|nr:conjugal transfer protein TraI [Chitinophaga niabensis]
MYSKQASSQVVVIEAIKVVAKKVIRAMDLQIQRIQNRTIDLQNIQRQIENVLSKLKLDEIAQWTEKQKELYKEYFDELWRIKSILRYYQEFKDIVDKQKQLFNEYKRAYEIVGRDTKFSEEELEYIYNVYSGILNSSIETVNDILLIMESFSVRMSDAERLKIISDTNLALDKYLADLRKFNQRNRLLSLQRAKSEKELEIVKRMYDWK